MYEIIGPRFYYFAMVILNMMNLCIHVALLGIFLTRTLFFFVPPCLHRIVSFLHFLCIWVLISMRAHLLSSFLLFSLSVITLASCKEGHHWLMY